VSAVASLREALQRAGEGAAPDLLITDYHLGDGETGIQVIAALRERLGSAVKSVLITGDTSTVIRELPADQHLRVASKPINAEELLSLLKSLMAGG
jgi:CheY-like chemotaxis protein